MPTVHAIPPVRALESLNLCDLARKAGWRKADMVRPDELLCGAAMLKLAEQPIAVRLLVNTGGDLSALLELVYGDVLSTWYLEQFIVMVGFSPEVICAYQAAFQRITTRRVRVGSLEAYQAWLPARLGPLAGISQTSPIRRLTEHLLCTSAKPEPRQKRPMVGEYEGSAIRPSFDLGQLGVQAVETLFSYTRGDSGVINVEPDKTWQAKDVDLLVRESGLGGRLIQVEVKNENKATGNIVLEKHSCYERKTPGWFDYSTAEVLASCLWPTGDLFLMEFAAIREWVRTTPRELRLVLGTVPEQRYHSQVMLAPLKRILTEVPSAIHLRLGDWLPRLYQENFAGQSLVPTWLRYKTLHPQRLM